MVLRPDKSLKTFYIDPVFIFLSKLFLQEESQVCPLTPAERHWFSPNNQQCLSTLIGSVKSFLCGHARVRPCQKIHYKQHRSKMFLHSLFTLRAAEHLLEQGLGVRVNWLCQSDGRVWSFTLIIRREWRLEGVKQTTFICFPTQSLSKWPLLGFHCNRIPPPHPPPSLPWSWVTTGLMQSQSGMALRGERGESASTNPLPCWGDAQQMGHSRNRGTSSLAVLWSY